MFDIRTADPVLAEVFAGREFLLFDGAMGTMLQAAGMRSGELPELLVLERPETVEAIHRAYVGAGCDVVTTCTFGANAHKLGAAATVDEVFRSAIACARQAGPRYVAADMGPTGMLLKPLGTLDFDEAYGLYAEQARAAQRYGADLVIVETMTDLLETKAAVLACKDNCDLPILASMTFGEDGCTFLGTSPEIAAMTLSALGVQAVGVNCSLGPDGLEPIVRRMAEFSRVPLIVQANAGLPHVVDGETCFDVGPRDYVEAVGPLIEAGATIVGGCCGTTPDYVAGLRRLLDRCRPQWEGPRDAFCICSPQRSVVLDPSRPGVAVIGERINPTGKKRLKEALRTGDYDYLVGEALDQKELGADALDVNVGLPELDEPAVLCAAMERIQAVCDLPLQIDSSDPAAIERAVRRYGGKALVNSVNGKDESLRAVLPLVARYGCAVVGLTLDEDGIPPTAEGRLAVARKIVAAAEAFGIPRQDVVVDCLCMAASTDQCQPAEVLRAVRLVKDELGCRTVLGVSNISFGLPQRELVNAVFLASAFAAGLDLAIMNPKSQRMNEVVAAYRVLNAQDEGASRFIDAYARRENPYDKKCAGGEGSEGGSNPLISTSTSSLDITQATEDPESLIRHLILSGRKGPMAEATLSLLAERDPLEAIDGCLIPALDEVGARFERGELFLPQLMASAEATKAAFDVIKEQAPAAATADKGEIVLATVKGDIHDIGKNIVKRLLENYGYRIYDLGRDVAPEAVVEAVLAHDVRLVGLSALMTTTVRSMERTIALLKERAPQCSVMVGGAVLNPEYARMVGADYYAKDAAESARIAGEFFGRAKEARDGEA